MKILIMIVHRAFEFHKGERSLHRSMSRPFSRSIASNWNDAVKWMVNGQNVESTFPKQTNVQVKLTAPTVTNMARLASACAGLENKASVERVDFCQPHVTDGIGRVCFCFPWRLELHQL